MDQIKEAFHKVRQDITSLNYEMDTLKVNLFEIDWKLSTLIKEVKDLKNILQSKEIHTDTSQQIIHNPPTQINEAPTDKVFNPTHTKSLSAHNGPFKPLKTNILDISTGNEGVPTDRQTNQQTDRHIENTSKNQQKGVENPISDAAKILDSLDNLKKEIRLKFKRLTEKEILVFSAIYQIEEEKGHTDYKTLSEKLGLTESSVRDYIGRLILKGIPVEKKKINNKTIHLFISKDLKKIAPLSTILQLRDL